MAIFVFVIKCAIPACGKKEELPLKYASTYWVLISSEEKKKVFGRENWKYLLSLLSFLQIQQWSLWDHKKNKATVVHCNFIQPNSQ